MEIRLLVAGWRYASYFLFCFHFAGLEDHWTRVALNLDWELTSALACGRPAASGERAPWFAQQFKHQARVKYTPFLAIRSHLRWQGELYNSHSPLQILLTSQPTSFPCLLPQGTLHCFYFQKAVCPLPCSIPHSCPTCMCKVFLNASLIKTQCRSPPHVPGTPTPRCPYRLPWYRVPAVLQALWVTFLSLVLQTFPKGFPAVPSM